MIKRHCCIKDTEEYHYHMSGENLFYAIEIFIQEVSLFGLHMKNTL